MQEMNSRSVPVILSSSDVKSDEMHGNGERSIRNSYMNALRMNGGVGENSYTSNSTHQQMVMLKAKPVLVENAREMLISLDFPSNIKVADLGCSSGQNTFSAMSQFVRTVDLLCGKEGRKLPEIECCLNDLFENDFNTTFKSVPFFHEKLNMNRGSCFVSGVPGSFYSRLFPSRSLHFVHSSYSLHFLSKVPEGIENNKKNVYITSSSPPSVYKAYLDQYQRDFWSFLRLRSEEMVPKGRMVLTFVGRKSGLDPLHRDRCHFWTLLSESLVDLVSEGLVSEAEMELFKLPWYDADEREVREMVEKEGSFEINRFETHEYDLCKSEDYDEDLRLQRLKTGQRKANLIRAVTEPMLVAHFGQAIVEPLFVKYAQRAAQLADCPHETTLNLVVSLTKIV